MSAVPKISHDPGPLARFNHVVSLPETMGVIVQRLCAGETLKQVAESWQIPYGRLAQWVIEDRERTEQYNAALRIWADSLAQETVGIADDVKASRDEVAKAKLRVSTRFAIAGKLNRERYGDATEVKHTGNVSLIAVLSSLPRGQVIDVTPAGATSAGLPPPGVDYETSLQKIPAQPDKDLAI